MNILDQIIAKKNQEITERKSLYPIKLLEKNIYYTSQPVSLKKYLLREDKSGIIAEIKRKSPSKGWINPYISVEKVSIGYMQAGASALSVLTDTDFFGGKNEDLTTARKFNYCPILRKDFIIDEYQIIESRSIGADVILLIAAALEPKKLKELTAFAKSLGMEVFLEVREKEEIESHLNDSIDIVGVNNRNLKDFKVNTDRSFELAPLIPDKFLKVSESGISNASTIVQLKKASFSGFLIGETFMQTSAPEKACAILIKELNAAEVKA